MYGLGFGLALAFTQIDGVPYLNYVVPGIMCSTIMFACLLDGIYGTMSRQMFHGLWNAQLATNVSLRLIMLAESTWAALRASVGASLVMLVGWAFGGVENLSTVFGAFFLLWFGGSALASIGQVVAAKATAFEDVDYVWAFLVSPMFLFCGTFIPVSSFPTIIQSFAQFLPLTHIVELVRSQILQTITLDNALYNIIALAIFWLISHQIAYTLFKKRLFS